MATGQAKPGLIIRPAETAAEMEACVQLQKQVWGFADIDLVPRRMFVVARKIGGLVLGAWDGAALAGFALALPGHHPGQTYWHSHMLAVAPEYRGAGLGRELKLRQREQALAQGIELIEWTFDPLEIMNGYFNLTRLGAIARRYHPDFYGQTSSEFQMGLPSDRLTAEWWLRSPRVAALAGNAAPAPVATLGTVEVPAELGAWRKARDPRALAEQTRIREALQAAFASGLAATDYLRRPAGGVFCLAHAEPL